MKRSIELWFECMYENDVVVVVFIAIFLLGANLVLNPKLLLLLSKTKIIWKPKTQNIISIHPQTIKGHTKRVESCTKIFGQSLVCSNVHGLDVVDLNLRRGLILKRGWIRRRIRDSRSSWVFRSWNVVARVSIVMVQRLEY